MSERLRKLEHAHKILIEKGNWFMAGNVAKAIEEEKKNPTGES